MNRHGIREGQGIWGLEAVLCVAKGGNLNSPLPLTLPSLGNI